MQGFYFDKPMPYDQFLARHTNLSDTFPSRK
jgi:EAL domain-containing protein (putative c-di-GMP-specific phosphodiesterase class I)